MQLADNEIEIRLNFTETVFLRPSLRAASRLESRHGFATIIEKIMDGNLTMIAEVITESATNVADLGFLNCLEYLAGNALADCLETVTPRLIELILRMTGHDPSQEANPAQSGESIPFKDYHTRLYRIATGWLGWAPETAWNATPAEIMEAYKGRCAMLKSIFGGEDTPDTTKGYDPGTLDRDGLNELRGMGRLI